MKFNVPIEVSGINRIVVDRKTIYQRFFDVDGKPLWGGDGKHILIDAHMMSRVKRMLREQRRLENVSVSYTGVNTKPKIDRYMDSEPKYRAWVHGDTLNIEKIDY